MAAKIVMLLVVMLVSLTYGIACLFWPEKVRDYFLSRYEQGVGKYLARFNFIRSWVKIASSSSYIRFLGSIAIVMFIITLILFVLVLLKA